MEKIMTNNIKISRITRTVFVLIWGKTMDAGENGRETESLHGTSALAPASEPA
jgi:hypothetical protein